MHLAAGQARAVTPAALRDQPDRGAPPGDA